MVIVSWVLMAPRPTVSVHLVTLEGTAVLAALLAKTSCLAPAMGLVTLLALKASASATRDSQERTVANTLAPRQILCTTKSQHSVCAL